MHHARSTFNAATGVPQVKKRKGKAPESATISVQSIPSFRTELLVRTCNCMILFSEGGWNAAGGANMSLAWMEFCRHL
jgi:hypothetical protein